MLGTFAYIRGTPKLRVMLCFNNIIDAYIFIPRSFLKGIFLLMRPVFFVFNREIWFNQTSFRNFRKYKSATIHFSRPYVDKYREEFKNGIGLHVYQKIILHLAEVKCGIIPFQSAAFTLGCNEALVKIHSGGPKEKEIIYDGLSETYFYFQK